MSKRINYSDSDKQIYRFIWSRWFIHKVQEACFKALYMEINVAKIFKIKVKNIREIQGPRSSIKKDEGCCHVTQIEKKRRTTETESRRTFTIKYTSSFRWSNLQCMRTILSEHIGYCEMNCKLYNRAETKGINCAWTNGVKLNREMQPKKRTKTAHVKTP